MELGAPELGVVWLSKRPRNSISMSALFPITFKVKRTVM